MSIQHAILGFLSWKPLSGYDLKKLFAESSVMHWSGNSNQIYRALVEMHQEGLVTREVQSQESLPARKEYSITGAGRAALRQWVMSTPEPPLLRNTFLVQLAWADQLSADELDTLLANYEAEMDVHARMLREQAQRRQVAPRQQDAARQQDAPQRTPREVYLWQRINQNWISFYETQLAWVRSMRQELGQMTSRERVE